MTYRKKITYSYNFLTRPKNQQRSDVPTVLSSLLYLERLKKKVDYDNYIKLKKNRQNATNKIL